MPAGESRSMGGSRGRGSALAEHGFELPGGQASKLITYHAQQCVEKYLKAYLVLRALISPTPTILLISLNSVPRRPPGRIS